MRPLETSGTFSPQERRSSWTASTALVRSSLSVCHFAIRWPRASLSGGQFAISCAILLSFVPNVRRIARRIAIAILCAKDVD